MESVQVLQLHPETGVSITRDWSAVVVRIDQCFCRHIQ